MKQVTINTGRVKMLVVDLPEGATLAGIVRDHLYYYSSTMTDHDYPYSDIIPDGFEGTECFQGILHITEEDWKGIVDQKNETDIDEPEVSTTSKDIEIVYYYDYVNKTFFGDCDTATESGLSLLKANGVVMENPLGEKPVYGSGLSQDFYQDHLEEVEKWEKAQSKVWLNPQVFIEV